MQKYAIVTVIAIMVTLASLLATCSDDKETNPKPPKGNVSGTVYRSDFYGTIPKIIVSIADKSYRTVTNGYYEIKNIPLGKQTITATKSGYEPYSAEITITKSTIHDIIMDPVLSDKPSPY